MIIDLNLIESLKNGYVYVFKGIANGNGYVKCIKINKRLKQFEWISDYEIQTDFKTLIQFDTVVKGLKKVENLLLQAGYEKVRK